MIKKSIKNASDKSIKKEIALNKFSFPEHGEVIEAECLDEANKILEKKLAKK